MYVALGAIYRARTIEKTNSLYMQVVSQSKEESSLLNERMSAHSRLYCLAKTVLHWPPQARIGTNNL